jgi:hypothetical protein
MGESYSTLMSKTIRSRILAIVEGFLRLLLQFHPKINPSGGEVDRAAKNKSESPSTTNIGQFLQCINNLRKVMGYSIE